MVATVLVGTLGVAYPVAASADPRVENRDFPAVTVATAAPGTQIRFPDVITLADGRLLAAFYSSADHTQVNGVIKTTISSDHGKTWSTPRLAMESIYDNRDPKLTQLSDGTVVLSYFQTQWLPSGDSIPQGTYTSRSDDLGESWDEPVRVGTAMSCACGEVDGVKRLGWAASHGPAIELPDGDVLLPLYGTTADDPRQRATVVRSTDGGRTFDADTEVTIALGDVFYQEPNLTLLPNGQIAALIRTYDDAAGNARNASLTRSDDGGHTWSPVMTTDIPAESHHQLLTSGGEVLVSYGNPFRTGRPTEAVLINKPEQSWDGYRQVPIYDAGTGDQANPSTAEVSRGRYITLGYNVDDRTLVAVFTKDADYD